MNWRPRRHGFPRHLHGDKPNDRLGIDWTRYDVMVRCRVAVVGILIGTWMIFELVVVLCFPW